MERIKRALELAEKNRLALADGAGPVSQPDAAAVGSDSDLADAATEAAFRAGAAGSTVRPAAADTPELGRFSRTRVVHVSPEHLEEHRIIKPDAGNDASRAYDMLASRLLERIRGSGWNSIAVVSPCDGEGKTLTAINLAIHLAASRERTALLVDLDFRRPSVARYLGLLPEVGIDDVLSSGASLDEALVSPSIERFSVLPVRRAHPNAAELIDSRRTRELAIELKQRYANRIVLFDLPPLLAYGDALRFLPQVDAALMVVTEARTQRESIERALSALTGQNLAGVVMNRASETAPGY